MSSRTSPQIPRPPDTSSSAIDRQALILLAGALLCLQLVLCEKVSFDGFRFSALCVAVLALLIWPRRGSLTLESGPISTLAGIGLIGLFLTRSAGSAGTLFATIAPAFWGVGFALLASGIGGLGQYWREGLILGAIVATPFVDTIALDLAGVDLAPLTAQTTAFLLRLGGWEASARDVYVGLPTAWILVSQGCSGLKTMYFLGGFSVLVLLMFPIQGILRRIAVVLAAIATGFIVNAFRVVLLALLSSPEHHRAFVFLHVQQGAMLFEVVAVVVFVAFYAAMIRLQRRPAPVPPAAHP